MQSGPRLHLRMHVSAGRFPPMMQYYAIWALIVSVRMTGTGIPGNSPLIERIPSSGRRLVT